jgi:hypothetical protein
MMMIRTMGGIALGLLIAFVCDGVGMAIKKTEKSDIENDYEKVKKDLARNGYLFFQVYGEKGEKVAVNDYKKMKKEYEVEIRKGEIQKPLEYQTLLLYALDISNINPKEIGNFLDAMREWARGVKGIGFSKREPYGSIGFGEQSVIGNSYSCEAFIQALNFFDKDLNTAIHKMISNIKNDEKNWIPVIKKIVDL